MRILPAIAATLVLAACGGGEGTKPSSPAAGGNNATGMQCPENTDPEDILAHPVPFDKESLENCAKTATRDSDPLTSAHTAWLIVNVEAAINHHMRLLEELAANDDMADTWNAMNEMDTSAWSAQIPLIVSCLERQPLSQAETHRLENIRKALNRTQALRRNLRCATN